LGARGLAALGDMRLTAKADGRNHLLSQEPRTHQSTTQRRRLGRSGHITSPVGEAAGVSIHRVIDKPEPKLSVA